MNRKNSVLTLLACLNCVHTTHAVEKQIEELMPEGLFNKKAVLYNFHGKCFNAGRRINDPDMIQDAIVQAAQILLDITTKLKDKIPHTDPALPVIEAVENVRRDIVNDLKNLNQADIEKLMQHQPVYGNNYVNQVSDYISELFNTKLEEQVKAGKFPELTVDTELDRPYEEALYSLIPHLHCADYLHLKYLDLKYLGEDFLPIIFPFDHSLNHFLTNMFGALIFEIQMTNLQTDLKNNYPDMAQPVWDIYKKVFRHQLNDYIRGNGDRFDIGNAIEKYLLNKPGIKQVTKTILDTIRQNANLDQGTDLYQRTVTALYRSKTLRRLVLNYIDQKNRSLMSLVNTMEHKKKISAPFGKMTKCEFIAISKYLYSKHRKQ